MAKIVVVHGMNQQYQSEFTLEENVRQALRSGVSAARRAGKQGEIPDASDVELVYYGDLFRKSASGDGVPTGHSDAPPADQPAGRGADASGFDTGLQFGGDAAPSPAPTNPFAEDYDADGDDNEPYSDEESRLLQQLDISRNKGRARLELSDEEGQLSQGAGFSSIPPAINSMIGKLQMAVGPNMEGFAKAFVKHLYRYLQEDDLAMTICGRLREKVGSETKLIIGHSMGTIITYEFLRTASEVLPNQLAYITLGPPLWLPDVRANTRITGIQKGAATHIIPFPRVRRWDNFACTNDPVTPHLTLAELVDRGPSGEGVHDHLVRNGKLAHAVERYLNSALTGERVLEALLH